MSDYIQAALTTMAGMGAGVALMGMIESPGLSDAAVLVFCVGMAFGAALHDRRHGGDS